jgi:hypothetical protein
MARWGPRADGSIGPGPRPEYVSGCGRRRTKVPCGRGPPAATSYRRSRHAGVVKAPLSVDLEVLGFGAGVSLVLWLLVKGVDGQRWTQLAHRTAAPAGHAA